MKKWTVALLVLSLFLALAGCGEKTDVNIPTADVSVDVSESEEMPGMPLTADFGKETFRILSAGNTAHEEFTIDEESSLPLENARYKQKAKVEED